MNTISGKGGGKIVLKESDIIFNSSQFLIQSDEKMTLGMSSRGAHFSIIEKYDKIEITSSDNVFFEKNVSIPELSSQTVVASALRAATADESLTVSSKMLVPLHISIGESCVCLLYTSDAADE